MYIQISCEISIEHPSVDSLRSPNNIAENAVVFSRVGTHCSTHQTKLELRFLLARLQEALYEDLPESIKFVVYHDFSGLSLIEEVNFWRPPKTIISYE